MTLFAVYDDQGRIIQANKTYDAPAGYEGQLRDLKQKFIKRETEVILNPDLWHVIRKRIRARKIMPVALSKKAIKAGGVESTVITGIPLWSKDEPTKFTIFAGDTVYESGEMPEGVTELEYSCPTPCRARIVIDKWPFQPCTVNVEVY